MSERPLIKGIGFLLFSIFPLTGLLMMILGYIGPPPPTPVTVPAVLYPLGLVYLTIYPPLIYKPGLPVAGTSYMKFAEGAWYGSVAIAILSLFQAAVLSLLFDQALIGFSLAAVSIGSLWLPAAPGATGLSMFLAGKGVKTSESSSSGASRFRIIDSAFLALFLGRFRQFARNSRIPTTFAALLSLYILGWIELSLLGGYPYTLFGIIMPAFLFASCYVTIHRNLRAEDLPKVLGSLPAPPTSSMPTTRKMLVRMFAIVAFLILLNFLVWLWTKP